MKKIILFFFVSILYYFSASAQTELWGTIADGGAYSIGCIYKADSAGNNVVVKYSFNGLTGRFPSGRLLSPGNGKLYGLTTQGGPGGGGVLYEYDMRTDSLRLLYNFSGSDPAFPYSGVLGNAGLVQTAPGILYGVSNGLGSGVFKFNLATNTIELAAAVPHFNGGAFNSDQPNGISGALFKASDGYLYSTTYADSQCPIGFPNAGAVVRINPADNSLSIIYPFSCTTSEGWHPIGDFVEANGKLYSNNQWGGAYGAGPTSPGDGTLYEYDPATNTLTKKHDFDGLTGYRPAMGLTPASNGKLYGVSSGGGTPYGSSTNGSGVLFEYDPVTGVFTKRYDFNQILHPDVGNTPAGTPLVQAGNGKLYGKNSSGIFEFDIATGTVRAAGRYPHYAASPSLIETCRPPAYRLFNDSVFILCEGTPFRFDLHCDNATAVTWLHNGIPAATHTSAILEFTNITAADAGTWECTLSNSCGTSQPAGVHLTVNPGAGSVTSVISPSGSHMICPGTSITLSGNSGGTWNTGATGAGITVSGPGTYQVTNNNSCGLTYSNIVTVDTIPSPAPIVITGPNHYLCYGDSITFSGNTGGIWNNGSSAYSITVITDTLTPHFVTLTHSCGIDSSNIMLLHSANFYVQDPAPNIVNGRYIHICQGQGVWLHSNQPATSSSGWSWWQVHSSYSDFLSIDSSIYVTAAGDYIISQHTICHGILRSDPITVIVDSVAPPPVITALGPLSICEGGSVTLQTTADNYLWSTGDTTSLITTGAGGAYHVTTSNACGSSTSGDITVTIVSTPPVYWTQTPNLLCVGGSPLTLSGVSPVGGTFSGTGASGSTFDPAATGGAGSYVLTYSYTNGAGCTGHVNQTITINDVPAVPVIYSSIGGAASSASICEGDSVQIVAASSVTGLWNTGQTFPVMYVKNAGNYHFTASNTCGNSTSADFTLNLNPLPDVTVSQAGLELTAALNDSYQWINCNDHMLIAGDTGQLFTATANGSYAVIVNSDGCSDTSVCYTFNTVGIENPDVPAISFYPNPAQDHLQIVSTLQPKAIRVEDITGRQVLVAGSTMVLNISGLAPGTYLLTVETEHGNWQRKFIKL